MTILVTGAAGFIGSHVCRALLERGDEVIGIDNLNDYYNPALKKARVDDLSREHGSGLKFEKLDISDEQALASFLENVTPSRIVHLAAEVGVRNSLIDPRPYLQANLIGHFNMIEAARRLDVDHFVYASTSSVYGNDPLPFTIGTGGNHPLNIYAATKRSGELMSEAYSSLYRIPMTGLRFFTVYGPWGRPDMAVWSFTEAIAEGKPITLFNHGKMRRDFTFVADIVAGILRCLDRPPPDDSTAKAGGSMAPHNLFNIGNNISVQLTDLVSTIEEAVGKKAIVELADIQPGEMVDTFADIDEIRAYVGYEPTTSIDQGIPTFVDWWRDFVAR